MCVAHVAVVESSSRVASLALSKLGGSVGYALRGLERDYALLSQSWPYGVVESHEQVGNANEAVLRLSGNPRVIGIEAVAVDSVGEACVVAVSWASKLGAFMRATNRGHRGYGRGTHKLKRAC
jgi:hypothetical protein